MTGPSDRPVVVALGGNALLRRGEPPDVARQRTNVEGAAAALAAVARGRRLVITHGNGPQVGVLALQSEASDTPSPLDVLGAETEGMIGYLISQALGNRMPGRPVATLLTQVVVAAADPAFGAPTKPIGPDLHRGRGAPPGRRARVDGRPRRHELPPRGGIAAAARHRRARRPSGSCWRPA